MNFNERREELQRAYLTSNQSVIGMDQEKERRARSIWTLLEELFLKVLCSDKVIFQYYAEPDILPLALKDSRLKKLKELI